MTLKEALAESRNIPAVKAFQSVDNEKIKEFVLNLGMTPEIDSEGKLHEAHALGSFTGTNPVQLAGAYAAFGNGGYYTKPYSVSKVEYIDSGKTVNLKSKTTKVMSDATAYMITDTLLYAVESFGNIGGTVWGVSLAAKTGTTNYPDEVIEEYGFPWSAINDLWTAGYTPEVSVALWYGYDVPVRGYYNTGGYTKNNLYRKIVSEISNRDVKQTFDVPSSVVRVTVEKETYPVQLPSENTPDDMKVTEYCKAGTEPGTKSIRYNKLDDVTGLSIKDSGKTVTLSWKAASEPKQTSLEYFKDYYKVLYSQHIEEKFAEMQAANGAFGYEISARNNSTNETTVLGFTTSTTYTVDKQENDTTYYVKTKYQNNNITVSPGVSIDIKGDISTIDPTNYEVSITETSTTLMIDTNKTVTFNLQDDMNTITVLNKNKKEITANCDIEVSKSCSTDGSCTISNDTVTINKAGTYTIKYTVSYKGILLDTITKTIIVKENKSSN